jgi:hypothetical protein
MNNITSIGYRQQGLSFLGWMVVVAIFGLLTISFFKIFPIYNENFTIQSVLNSVKDDQKIDPKSKRAIWNGIINRLSVNHILSIKRENVKIERKNGKTTVTITYETRRPYIGNLFIGGNFSESVVIDR